MALSKIYARFKTIVVTETHSKCSKVITFKTTRSFAADTSRTANSSFPQEPSGDGEEKHSRRDAYSTAEFIKRSEISDSYNSSKLKNDIHINVGVLDLTQAKSDHQ